VLQEDLISRILNYESLFPSAEMPTHDETVAAFDRLKNLSDYGRSVFSGMGVDVNDESRYDWQFPTYAEFDVEVMKIESYLNSSGVGPGSFAVFSSAYVEVDQGQGKKGNRNTTIMSKLAAALGVREGWQGIVAVLEAEYPELVRALARNLALKRWGRVATVLKSILKVMMTRAFWKALAKKVGAKTTQKIMGRIMARWVPFLGWILIIGSFIWAFAEQLL